MAESRRATSWFTHSWGCSAAVGPTSLRWCWCCAEDFGVRSPPAKDTSADDEYVAEHHAAAGTRGEDLMNIEQRTVTLHGHRLAYRIGGRSLGAGRPVLMLLHGMADSAETWSQVLPGLASRFTVIAPDMLGHGNRTSPDTITRSACTPTSCATSWWPSGSSGRHWSATRSAEASRCSSPTSSRNAANASCWYRPGRLGREVLDPPRPSPPRVPTIRCR